MPPSFSGRRGRPGDRHRRAGSADETDDVFVSVIEAEGIPFSTPEDAIVLAHAVCDYVAAGQAPEQVAVEISEPANWTVEQSGFFVGAATQSYCPA